MANKIASIGTGNLGTAIALGLTKSDVKASDITVTRRNLTKIDHLKNEGFQMMTNNTDAIAGARLIFLCVQPKQLSTLLNEIKSSLSPNQIVVSTITGVSTEEIASHIEKKIPIVRAMPNTAIAIGKSMTCLCAKDADEKQLAEG